MLNLHRNYGMIKCLQRLLEIQQETLDKIGITYPKYWVRMSLFLITGYIFYVKGLSARI